MKGKTLLNIGIFLVIVFYWINIGAFVVTDVGEDYPGNAIAVGVSQSWANVAVWESGTGLVGIPIVVLFAIVEAFLLRSYNKKGKLWKKVLIIISGIIMLLFSLLQFVALLSVAGEKYTLSKYMFTYSTTGTVYILYLAVLLVVVGVVLKLIEGFRLSTQLETNDNGES